MSTTYPGDPHAEMAQAPAERAWTRRKAQRAPEILAAARRLFEQAGAAQTSVADIARAAGVSEATVFKYFGPKQALVDAVIRDWMEPAIVALERALPRQPDLRAKLRFVARGHLAEMRRSPGLHRLVYRELRWTDYAGSPLHALNRRYTRLILRAVEAARRAGAVRADTDAAVLRDAFFGALEHVGWRIAFAGAEIDLDRTADDLATLLLRGAMADPPDAGIVQRLERAVARLEGACPP